MVIMAPGIQKVRVPELLKERGWSASDLMRKSGLSWPTAQGLAAGKPMNLTIKTINILCDVFGVGLDELVVEHSDEESS